MIDYMRSAFRNLGRKRTRTVLTILGIAIGVASVLMVAGISQSGTDALTAELNSLGLSGLSVSAGKGQNVTLTDSDLSLIRKFSQVEQASPIMVENTSVTVRKNQTKALLWGIDPGAGDIISLQVLYGRLFNQKDIATCANVCLVDEAFSQTAYHRNNMIGKTISLQCGGAEQPFTVVGVIETGTGLLQNLIGEYIPTFIYVPYTTIQAATDRGDFDEIAVKIRSGDDADGVGKMIVNHLDDDNGTAGAFVTNNFAKQKNGLIHILEIVTLILSAVGAISLLVASLGIMTVMLVSVNERTREIGIKKALGATRAAIMLEFLFEAGFISLIGCFFGIAVSCTVFWIGAAWFHTAVSIRPDIMLMAAVFSVCSGIIFGVYPAYKASNLKPVDALRQE